MATPHNEQPLRVALMWNGALQAEHLLSTPSEVVIGDAMLVGRLRRAHNKNGTLTPAGTQLPTDLWLGAVPGGDDGQPSLGGQLVQDTYIRVFLPVTPSRQ